MIFPLYPSMFIYLSIIVVAPAYYCTNSSEMNRESSQVVAPEKTNAISESTIFMSSQELPPTIEDHFVESANDFALNFFRSYSKRQKGNIVFSPLSLHIILDMIFMGTNQHSKSDEQLAATLGYHNHFKNNSDKARQVLMRMVQEVDKVNSDPELIIKLENMLLVNNETFKLNDEYKNNLSKVHSVYFEQFNSRNKSNLHEQINEWVRNKTGDQIKKIVQSLDVENADAMFLNAAYFKGKWLQTFKSSETSSKPFYNTGDEKNIKNTDFMGQQNVFGFIDFSESISEDELDKKLIPTILNCSVLSLPFSANDGQDMSMVFLLPFKKDGLPELISSLNASNLIAIHKYIIEQQVQVELPKFSFESAAPAKDILTDIGLKSIFDFSQDLSKMTNEKKDSKVDAIIHKAKITIDEAGAEAAAASSASIVIRNFVPLSRSKFVANHPFLFIIRHTRSNLPIFIGRVSEM